MSGRRDESRTVGGLVVLFVLLMAVVTGYTTASQASSGAGSGPSGLIDPDCEPERAAGADPAAVAEPDEVCPPDYVAPPEPDEIPKPGADPAPAPVSEPAPAPRPKRAPAQPAVPPAPGRLEVGSATGSSPAPVRRKTRRRGAPRELRRKRQRSRGGRRWERSTRAKKAPRKRSRSLRGGRRRDRPHARSGPVRSGAPGIPGMIGGRFRVPALLMPIYRAAGERYGVRWEILAAINEIETGYGRNLNVSSAGAVGWMQFMPSTWRAYGVDADGDGRKDPYDPMDAIFAAARYLDAAGYERDERRAIFAYNHADWYVDSVLLRARSIAAFPAGGAGLGGSLPDPLPPARRLDGRFAAGLERIADRSGLSWALMLAVLRARGRDGAVPASRHELSDLARKLVALGARSHPRRALRRMSPAEPFTSELGLRDLTGQATFAQSAVALTHYNRAVGLAGLVRGLDEVRERLAQRVLRNRRLDIYPGGRADVASGLTDVRVLVLLRYLASRHREVTVTSLTTGHGYLTASGNVSAHSYGRAVDVAALDGKQILGNQGPGGITERALWSVLLLPQELQPSELISLFELGGPSFALADHADHIHLGY